MKHNPQPFTLHSRVLALAIAAACCVGLVNADDDHKDNNKTSDFTKFRAPANNLPATREVLIDGYRAAVLPSGRLLTPAGVEVNVDAPKPFGLALSPDGKMLATVNSGASRFSVSLIKNIASATPTIKRVNLDATFLGVVFSPDSKRFYVGGGQNGNVWVGDAIAGQIIGSVNLNGTGKSLVTNPGDPLKVGNNTPPPNRFNGAYPGQLTVSPDGHYVYVVDQASFKVHVIDTTKIETGVNANGDILKPDNFDAVISDIKVGRYPFGIKLSADGNTVLVSHVGIFEYAQLRPANPTGDDNVDYPLCYPGAGYPDETKYDRNIQIKKVDPRNLPTSLRDPDGICCGYVPADQTYKVPGLGSPNDPKSSSLYVLDVSAPTAPKVKTIVKTGLLVGEKEDGIVTYSGSHPNSIAFGPEAIYVANGNNDSISVLHPLTYKELGRIKLSLLKGENRKIKGVQPVALAMSPDEKTLYVAEAGVNAIGVIRLEGKSGKLAGHIPTGWWPSSVAVSADGRKLYVANASGRGATPNIVDPPGNEDGSPKHSTLGTVNIIPVPVESQLASFTQRVYANNGFVEQKMIADNNNPIPNKAGMSSKQIKHIIFLNKENATHDLIFGDITSTRKGVAVNSEPSFALGYDASPNHHELALSFGFSDNFFLEPSVSSDGHRWLTNTYTAEFEETHWPADYGGRRSEADDDPEVNAKYPGRKGFTDANASPEPNDYNQHGGIYMHLKRHNKSFINFGNGFEFALISEPFGTEPTGAREKANVPMEKVVRDNSDHLYPTYNTRIPDAPLPEDPTRFSRFGRFKQVFEDRFLDKKSGECKLPSFVDLYYPNDHGGGANHINPTGQAWGFKRYVQDNDAALGMTVELISHSPCWKDTVIFVMEDDTQNGFDHVEGHRSIFLTISPWAKHEYVSKTHTSLSSIFKTIDLILGMPPLNQYDAAATDLRDFFTSKPDFTPYTFAPIAYAKGANPTWLALSSAVDFTRPDADEVKLREAIMKSEGLPRAK
ncbi:bifunctional YncE family protein/alkaline phosphatase family protein [Methyloglobulus sp.]|uniref:bifunctional YncE family protein/alkaline phosphatase family protein n=1 Tax=Methyloglobulus sp. TaxID=2518622 RepID=UPI0032B7E5CE